MKGVVSSEQYSPHVDFDASKDKKKKRRSNRRSRQNLSASVNEIYLEAPEPLGIDCKSEEPAIANGQKLPEAYNFAFTEQGVFEVGLQSEPIFPSGCGEIMSSTSYTEIIEHETQVISICRRDVSLSHQIEGHAQRKYFAPHWSMEAVNSALEKGNVFKAVFRVNAYNRVEAYCKIDGVPVDVLISGFHSQNRAVEGDIVAIKIDPLSSWTRMKGSTEASSQPSVVEDSDLLVAVVKATPGNCDGKNKINTQMEYVHYPHMPSFPEKGFYDTIATFHGDHVDQESIEPAASNYVNGNHHMVSDHSLAGSSFEQSVVVKLCTMISSFPSKRPTGRVVAIVKRSPRREGIVGFLQVKQWLFSKGSCRKDFKRNNLLQSYIKRDYIPFIPTDPKFPKLMVPVKSLSGYIKKRLDDADTTIELELVAARIVDWDEEHDVPRAHIVEVFGRRGEIEPHIAAILFENAIHSSEFSPETLSCLPQVPWEVPREEFQRRRDVRNLCTFTIDPATATDLDDALSVERLSNGIYRVGVHIADVSYFVLPQTALDVEAQIRATSVYLLQRKISMLPSLLSEDLGSLNPGVDRLAFSIFWDINDAGEVLDRWIGRTVIQSCCKLSYEHAQNIIDDAFNVDSEEIGFPHLHGRFQWSDVISSIHVLHEISKILKGNRFNDGALSLENPKVVFLFDEDGTPYDTVLSGRNYSNFLVEEFMLLANKTAAEVITRAYPSSALLRRHPEPNLRKLREFETFCSKQGLELNTSTSGQLHHSLECIKHELKNDSVLFDVLMSYATRPMQLASYFCSGDLKDNENDWGHYTLAVPLYTHFTSPLRRYPDIVVHRTLAAALEAEEMYLQLRRASQSDDREKLERCFSGLSFNAAESLEAQELLAKAALKYAVPCTETLAGVAAHCNERKLASRHVKDATDKLYMWLLLKKKEVLFSEARVLGIGPRFMSIYVHKLAIERRIYYDETEGLTVEWLDATSTLILSFCGNKRIQRRGSPSKFKPLEEVALVVNPYNLMPLFGQTSDGNAVAQIDTPHRKSCYSDKADVEPTFFPLTIHLLSTIPVAIHAIGGEDGPLDIGARLFAYSDPY